MAALAVGALDAGDVRVTTVDQPAGSSVPAPESATTVTAPDAVPTTVRRSSGAPTSAPVPGTPGQPDDVPSPVGSPPVPTTTAPRRAAAAPAEGCELEGDWLADRSDGDYPTCTYTASVDAGYEAYGFWTLTIKRPDGTERTVRQCPDNVVENEYCFGPAWAHGEGNDPPRRCEAVGFVRRGDRVTVRLDDGGHGPPIPPHGGHGPDPYFRVGPEHHC